PLMFLILAQIIIFILGCPLEWTEIIVIFIPIFIPLLPHFGPTAHRPLRGHLARERTCEASVRRSGIGPEQS
ncbi:hypothetical protein ACCS78_36105, partial [Rhizobium johnstonii]